MKTNNFTHPLLMKFKLLAIPASLTLLTACSGGGSSSNNDAEPTPDNGDIGNAFTAMIVDASDNGAYQYLNLNSGEMLTLTEEAVASSTAWHIAFRRNNLKVNGGASGSGNVAVALAVSQDDFYDAEGNVDANVFLNATPDSEEEHILAAFDVTTLDFQQDILLPAIAGSSEMDGTLMDLGWYNYDVATHQISVNTDNGWIVSSAEGSSHAKMVATAVNYESGVGLDASFLFSVETDTATGFSQDVTFNASVPASGGEQCYDFDSGNSVECDTAEWDVKLKLDGRDWNLWTNGGVTGSGSAGAFGPLATDSWDSYVSSVDVPTNHFITDASGGLFENHPWYAYNLQGQHKLWPNYRVYVIDTDTTNPDSMKYKLQVTNYYSDAGVSGYPNIRFMAVE